MNVLSDIRVQPGHIKQSKPKDYAIRFLFGGGITVVVGIVGKAFGPVVAGLLLAFPAILPASATLIAKHETEAAAGADAMGAALGAVGLVGFGIVVWQLAERAPGWLTITVAAVLWLVVSVVLWILFASTRRVRVRGATGSSK